MIYFRFFHTYLILSIYSLDRFSSVEPRVSPLSGLHKRMFALLSRRVYPQMCELTRVVFYWLFFFSVTLQRFLYSCWTYGATRRRMPSKLYTIIIIQIYRRNIMICSKKVIDIVLFLFFLNRLSLHFRYFKRVKIITDACIQQHLDFVWQYRGSPG